MIPKPNQRRRHGRMTIIAVASIIIAGYHHQFRLHGPSFGGRKGGRDGAHFTCAAAGCFIHHHSDLVCGSGDDRIHGHLLLRGFDDPHLRESVLEPCDRQSHRESTMLIDWFTVGAQALNFVILVWLMKRFFISPSSKPSTRGKSGLPRK